MQNLSSISPLEYQPPNVPSQTLSNRHSRSRSGPSSRGSPSVCVERWKKMWQWVYGSCSLTLCCVMTCAKHLIRIMCLLYVKTSWDGNCFDHSYFTENKAESRVIWPGLQTLIIDWHSIHLVHRTPNLKSFYHDKTPSLHKYMKYYLYIQSISPIRARDACRWGLGWFFLSTQKNPWHRRVNCWKRMSWPLQILTDEEKNHRTRKQVCLFSL